MRGLDSVTFSFVLDRLSGQLDVLAARVHETEEAVGKALQAGGTEASVLVARLQTLDYLRQSLEDCALLALLLAKIKHAEETDINVEQITKKLRLESTRDLLSQHRDAGHATGDIQLF